MIKRFTVGFVCGYLVGARSGRERYDQLFDTGQRLLDLPLVRDVVSSGQDRARNVSQRVSDAFHDAVDSASGGAGAEDPTPADAQEHEEATEGQEPYDEEGDDGSAGTKPAHRSRNGSGRDRARRAPAARPRTRTSQGPKGRGRASGLARAAATALERGRAS